MGVVNECIIVASLVSAAVFAGVSGVEFENRALATGMIIALGIFGGSVRYWLKNHTRDVADTNREIASSFRESTKAISDLTLRVTEHDARTKATVDRFKSHMNVMEQFASSQRSQMERLVSVQESLAKNQDAIIKTVSVPNELLRTQHKILERLVETMEGA